MEHEFDIEFNRINREFLDMRKTLLDDVQALLIQLNGDDKQVLRRAVYRAMFAYIEGMVFLLKQEVMLFRKPEGWEPQGKERWLLTEKKEIPTSGGAVVTVGYHVPLSRSVPYTFRKYACMHWFDFEVDTRNLGWKCLLEAVRVRNRVTHPKCSQDLIVADEEVQLLTDGVAWFDHTLITMFTECGQAYLRRSKALENCFLEN